MLIGSYQLIKRSKNKRVATGPAVRIDRNGNVRACETTHHDFRPIEQDKAAARLSIDNSKSLAEALQRLSDELTRTPRTQAELFAEYAEKYGDKLMKSHLDTQGEWVYHIEMGGTCVWGKQYRKAGDKLGFLNYQLIRSVLIRRREFRRATEDFRKDYFNYLKQTAWDVTRRYERKFRGERHTVRVKSK